MQRTAGGQRLLQLMQPALWLAQGRAGILLPRSNRAWCVCKCVKQVAAHQPISKGHIRRQALRVTG